MKILNILMQTTEPLLRQSGKIYTVIGVISIIFICIVIYLIYLNQKIRKLEK